jgi:hypothetical protein
MASRILNALNTILRAPFKINALKSEVLALNEQVADQKILSGKILSGMNRQRAPEIIKDIHLAEFKVFSQWGDDGIIQFLINYLDIETKTFVEFGVEDYREANTRFLLLNNNWSGLVMDGSATNMLKLKKEDIYWKYNLTAATQFITKENINSLLKTNGIYGETGLLHIDIDGNDYWIWKEISVISPVIVIVEFNSVFGLNPWTVPYESSFNRTAHHSSNLFWGCSVSSLCDLAETKGYAFIGCNSNGVNAYFVRKDKMKDLIPLNAENGYVESKYRESRDKEGVPTFLSGEDRLKELKGMTVFNSRLEKTEII